MPITLSTTGDGYNFDQRIQLSLGTAVVKHMMATGLSTAGDTTVDLFVDGSSALAEIPEDTAWRYRIGVAAVDSSGDAAIFDFSGGVKNIGGTTALIGDPSPQFWYADDDTWDCLLSADDSVDSLRIIATGDDTNDTNWTAGIDLVQVAG